DPAIYHTGRAPLEAAAQRIPLSASDWVFRCNLVTVIDGVMKDHSAGGVSDADARTLLELLRPYLPEGVELHPGVSYRNLMVCRGDFKFDLTTKPPHEMPEEPAAAHLPTGDGQAMLRELIETSARLFSDHPVVKKHLDQ